MFRSFCLLHQNSTRLPTNSCFESTWDYVLLLQLRGHSTWCWKSQLTDDLATLQQKVSTVCYWFHNDETAMEFAVVVNEEDTISIINSKHDFQLVVGTKVPSTMSRSSLLADI